MVLWATGQPGQCGQEGQTVQVELGWERPKLIQDSVEGGVPRGMLKFKFAPCLHRCLELAAYSRVFDALLMYYALLLKHKKLFWAEVSWVELKFKLVPCLHRCLEPAAHSWSESLCASVLDAVLMCPLLLKQSGIGWSYPREWFKFNWSGKCLHCLKPPEFLKTTNHKWRSTKDKLQMTFKKWQLTKDGQQITNDDQQRQMLHSKLRITVNKG